MILKRIRLNPFGCIANREFNFQSGMNIILGPNEAGKSTVFNAVQKVLFTPTRLRKTEFEKEIRRFIPIGGGDTIHVELDFIINENPYVIKRTWGGRTAADFILPDGSVISDENSIREYMNSKLPAREGTFRSILMTYQSGLSKTVEELDKEAVRQLGDILRVAMYETDGVSVDRFKEKIDRLYNKYFDHWDRKEDYPEKGRGIENRWQKEVGHILEAFYKKERISKSLKDAIGFEEALDSLNHQLSGCMTRIAELENYISRHKKAVDDARERRLLDLELSNIRKDIQDMKAVNSQWGGSESEIEKIKKTIPALKEKLKTLEKERGDALTQERNKGLRERFNKIKDRKDTLDKAAERLNSVQKLDKTELEEIRASFTEVNTLKTSMTAGKLTLNINAKAEFSLKIQKDLDEIFTHHIDKDRPLNIEAGGIIRLEHPDWTMMITSGEGNMEDVLKQYSQSEARLNELLKKHNLKTLDDANSINRIYEECSNELERAKKNLKDELGTDSYDELARKIREMPAEHSVRPIEDIIEQISAVNNEITKYNDELEYHRKVIKDFEEKYKTKDELLISLAQALNREREINEKIRELAPLPEGIEDMESFIKGYDQKKEELGKERDRKNQLQLEIAELERPEQSSEELKVQLKEAEEEFLSIKKKGEAIARIRDLTERILKQLDADTFEGLKRDLEDYISRVTEKRYCRVKMDGSIPKGFIRSDSELLSHNLLSAGTQDVLSLALRLAMANHFLKEANGFLMMDDPLVNIDPERQHRAAELLKTYAAKKQIIILTCHPLHAELLGGNKIEI